MVPPHRGGQILVVRRREHVSPDAGTRLLPLQPVEIPATGAMEGGGKATGCNVGRCRHMHITELYYVEECDQAVMEFLAATEVGKFPPRC
jgi:hypothetical protein